MNLKHLFSTTIRRNRAILMLLTVSSFLMLFVANTSMASVASMSSASHHRRITGNTGNNNPPSAAVTSNSKKKSKRNRDSGKGCEIICLYMLRSSMKEADSDYWLAMAKAANIPTTEERNEARQDAREAYEESIDESNEQFLARKDVCQSLGEDFYNPVIDPNNFVNYVDNPYFPLVPGTTLIYEGNTSEGTEHIEVTATHDTKEILGVTCIVVRDTVTLNGELVEDTFDWYAQDVEGNVWYFGEKSMEYADGEIVSLEGSWKAGEDDAKPGIVMKANPQVGDFYRQEFALGEAEDVAEVLSLTETAIVPYGNYSNCLMTEDYTPIEPDALENKYYAVGVGVVLEIDLETGERVELVDIQVN